MLSPAGEREGERGKEKFEGQVRGGGREKEEEEEKYTYMYRIIVCYE